MSRTIDTNSPHLTAMVDNGVAAITMEASRAFVDKREPEFRGR